ncbi:MAG: hypothetical protein Q9203_004605 [Teloschistes exilis]
MFADFAALQRHGMWSHEKVYMPNILRSVVAAVFTTPHPLKSHFFRRKTPTGSFAGSVMPEMQGPIHPNLTPAPQPVRIRSSCDSCSEAKVKCDKRRPACERCTSNQLQCTYSISRRHGSKRRLTRGQGVTAQATAKVPQQIVRADGASSASAIEEHNSDTVGFSTYGYNEAGESGTATEAITFHNNHDLLNPLQYLADDDFAVNSNVDTSKPSASGLGNTLPTLYDLSGDVHFSPSQQENGQAPCLPYATPSTTSVHGEDSRISEYSCSDATDTFKKLNQASGHGTPKEVHDCEAFALTLLRSLHHWPLHPTDEHHQMAPSTQACAFPEPYPDTNTAGSEAIPSLDTILHANKCALSGVVKLLECSCARKPHLATLYMSIITKILSLYELAVSTDISLPGSSSSTTSTDPMQNSSSRPHLARTAIIQVGVFDLDEEDQATLQRGILLRQLRNMERAIEKFACLDNMPIPIAVPWTWDPGVHFVERPLILHPFCWPFEGRVSGAKGLLRLLLPQRQHLLVFRVSVSSISFPSPLSDGLRKRD